MWRRLSKEDFEGTNLVVSERHMHGTLDWRVYKDYEVVPSADGEDYIQATSGREGIEPTVREVYQPLVDKPYLFRDFARLRESKNADGAVVQWVRRYGVPGLTQRNPTYRDEGMTLTEYRFGHLATPDRYDDRGGPGDTTSLITAEADRANRALRLYEAALSGEAEKLEQILLEEYPGSEQRKRGRREVVRYIAERRNVGWTELIADKAMFEVLQFAVHGVRAFAYPDVSFPGYSSAPEFKKLPVFTPDKVSRGWGVRNLLGAVYLQFYWVVTSGEGITKCRYCGQIISYEPPILETGVKGRKPRSNKEFCDSRCRQNYHYHNRIKPNR